MTKQCFYTVVENAGYEGEQDVRTCFSTAHAAYRWAERHYGKSHHEDSEFNRLHVGVCRESADGREYV